MEYSRVQLFHELCSKLEKLPPVHDGNRGQVLAEEQRKLKKEHKKAGEIGVESLDTLNKQHENRCKLLTKMGVDVKRALKPSFELS